MNITASKHAACISDGELFSLPIVKQHLSLFAKKEDFRLFYLVCNFSYFILNKQHFWTSCKLERQIFVCKFDNLSTKMIAYLHS